MVNIHYTLWKIFQWNESGVREQWKSPVLPSKQPCPLWVPLDTLGGSIKNKDYLWGDKQGQSEKSLNFRALRGIVFFPLWVTKLRSHTEYTHHSDSGIIMVSNIELSSHILDMIKLKTWHKGCHVKFMVSQSLLTAKDFNSNLWTTETANPISKFHVFRLHWSGPWPVLFSAWSLLAGWMPLRKVLQLRDLAIKLQGTRHNKWLWIPFLGFSPGLLWNLGLLFRLSYGAFIRHHVSSYNL